MIGKTWRRFWARAPRQLKFTRAGKVIVGIAFATGFAAINTGNNLLFLGWGLVLSSIVLSGILSEANIRSLDASLRGIPRARVGEVASLPLMLHNASRHVPSFSVESALDVEGGSLPAENSESGWAAKGALAQAPYQLRLSPREHRQLFARFSPQKRGRHSVSAALVATAYPFGFFEKSRRVPLASKSTVWVFPAEVDVEDLMAQVTARVGEAPARQVGAGEDYFSLRPFRDGDDVRRVHWRRSAKTGRLVVRETEAQVGREVFLELWLGGRRGAGQRLDCAEVEYGISVLASLAERLLEKGYRVGVRAPGTYLAPETGDAQRWSILLAMAQLEPNSAMPPSTARQAVGRVALTLGGATVSEQANLVLSVGLLAERQERIR